MGHAAQSTKRSDNRQPLYFSFLRKIDCFQWANTVSLGTDKFGDNMSILHVRVFFVSFF